MEKKTTKTKKAPAKKTTAKPRTLRKAAVEAVKEEKPLVAETLEVEKALESEIEAAVEKEDGKKSKKYFEAVGRRKQAIARVRLFTIKPFEEDEGRITVNGKPYKQYFTTFELQQIAEASSRRLKSLNRFEVVAKINGGGVRGQAEALRHGLARCLVDFNLDFRKKLKKAGFIKRDPRVKERRKYGLKKARRAPQWAKR